MAKMFLEFEEKMIDPNDIKIVERGEEWDDKAERMIYTIIINNPALDDLIFLKRLKFPFPTIEKRDIGWQDLRDKLEELGVVFL